MPTRLSTGYFDRIYSESDDPWQLGDRWYEQRKYAITLALLPYRRYRHAFEPGCSIGVLTEQLTTRCDHVTSTDIASAALDATHRRLVDAGRRHNVTLLRRSVDEPWPQAGFDLVVLSEIGYYLDHTDLSAVIDRTVGSLAPDGFVVACHWRHPAAGYPLTGDEVHDRLRRESGLQIVAEHIEEDFRLDVFVRPPGQSVARREGLLG